MAVNAYPQNYFPLEEFNIECMDTVLMDTFSYNWYSERLADFEEPSLYTMDTASFPRYRFLWLRSFHDPIVMAFHIDKEPYVKISKGREIDVNGDGFTGSFIDASVLSPVQQQELEDLLINGATYDSINTYFGATIAVYEAKVFEYQSNIKLLNKEDVHKIKKLFEEVNFWSMSSRVPCELGDDGAEWIIETRLGEQYHFVDRWSPRKKSEFRKLGEQLIKLAGLKKEKIY